MNKIYQFRIPSLFFLFFTFQWLGQFAAFRVSEGGSFLFLLLMYGGIFIRSLIWMDILRDMKLISAYSISSLSYLCIPLLSRFLLNEAYTNSHLAGGILILAGVTVYSMGEQKTKTLVCEAV